MVAPSARPALWQRIDDTNTDKGAIVYGAASNTYYDWTGNIPGDYGSGGDVRLWWRCASAATTAARWQIGIDSASVGEASDSAPTNDAVNEGYGGTSNIVASALITTTEVLAANDFLTLTISRQATNAGDTILGASVVLLNSQLEYVQA